MAWFEQLFKERIVKTFGGATPYPIFSLELANVGKAPASIAAAVGETDIDIPLNQPFFPRDLSIVFSTTNSLDYIEIFVLDPRNNAIKKLASLHYIATTTDNLIFADNRDAIPSTIYPGGYILRIAFQNKSATAYTVTAAWTIWTPTN